jgi:hypothetical protein
VGAWHARVIRLCPPGRGHGRATHGCSTTTRAVRPKPPQGVLHVFKKHPETWAIPLVFLALMLALGVWGTVQGSNSQVG